jgi:aldehyde:ferredoxin oxidoreductase
MLAYSGKILSVDLSQGKTSSYPLNEDYAKKYIGGIGLGMALLLENSKPNNDAFNPDNPLILSTGAFSGTIAPTGGNGHAFVSKSPLTNALGEAKSHGFFGSELKRAGYDAIIFRKRAEKPVYVWIDDDSVELVDAKNLWGVSPAETEDMIREELGDYYIRVASIGMGGEKLTRFACIMNDKTRAAGRTGMGAVMGSKNLKAIAIRGTKDVSVDNPEDFISFVKMMHERMKGPSTVKYRTLGTALNVMVHNSLGALPTRNFSNAVFEGASKVSGEYLNENFIAKVVGCSSCAMRCEHIAVVPEGPYKGTTTRMEYEPLWAFGPHCGVDRLDAIIKAIDLCNYYGLDNLSTGNVVGFSMDCFENGIIDTKDTESMDLSFGNAEAIVDTVHKIGQRKGLGNILAEGVKRASEKIGNGAEKYANHIKGLEMTGYDIRGLKTAAMGFAVSFRGADHNRHGAYGLDLKGKVDRFKAEKGRAKLVIEIENLYTVIDSLIVCKFSRGTYYEGFEDLARYYTLATGIKMTAEELRKTGERINNLGRLFNIREGLTRKDDHLPPKIMNCPIPDETVSKGSYVSQKELDLMLDDYYSSRGWTEEGVPTIKKLKELELENLNYIIKKSNNI